MQTLFEDISWAAGIVATLIISRVFSAYGIPFLLIAALWLVISVGTLMFLEDME